MAPFISDDDCKLELGLSEAKWGEFLQSSGLVVYRLPGGARVLNRQTFYAYIAFLMDKGGVPAPAGKPMSARRGAQEAA